MTATRVPPGHANPTAVAGCGLINSNILSVPYSFDVEHFSQTIADKGQGAIWKEGKELFVVNDFEVIIRTGLKGHPLGRK